MEPLSATASIISILQLSSKVVGYLNDVKDASRDRAKCAIEAANLNSLLTVLRFRLEDGNTSTPWYTAVRALAVENGPLDQFKQALEELQAKMTGTRTRRTSDTLIWKFKKEEITIILGRMERLKTLVQIALEMDHFKLSRAIKECADDTYDNTEVIKADTSIIRAAVPLLESGIDTIRHGLNLAKHEMLMSWVSTTDFPAQQSDIISHRQEGTGQWFLDTTEFTKWLEQPKSMLFCPGIPGAGKTMIAAIVIHHLLRNVQNTTVGVAYVYCNYKAQDEHGTAGLLAAILKQLVQIQPSTVELVERLHDAHRRQGTKPLLEEIFGVLQSVIATFSSVYIIIDALDECQERDGTRRQFLAQLQKLQTRADLRLMVTSRVIPAIMDELSEALKIEVRASDGDVRQFIAGQINRLPYCIRRDPALQNVVQERITEAVDGMFLLARLHTDSLLDKRTKKDVKSTLEKFSKGSTALDDAYREATQRIEGQLSGDRARAKQVLSWITNAKRPLSTAELCCALAVDLNEKNLDPDNIPYVEDIVSVCAGLVTVDKESQIIRLVHYTTQEYFQRILEKWNPGAQLEIASKCIAYLSLNIFEKGACLTDEELEGRFKHNRFLDYAAKHWGEHAAMVQDEVCEIACSFLLQDTLVLCAAQAMSVPDFRYPESSQQYPRLTKGLHIAAQYGLHKIFEELLNRSENKTSIIIDEEDGRGRTPLYLGAEVGCYALVKLLVDKGADVNMQSGYYGNPLCVASVKGHEQVLKLLLHRGANVNAQSRHFGNALQAASVKGHEQVVKLLLDEGADINAQSGHFGSALQAASAKGHEQIVELLLNEGADVNAQGGHFGGALQAASDNGHELIFKLLLNRGANINMQGGFYSRALYAASFKGHEHIVKLLLNIEADMNAQGRNFSNALQAASAKGHEHIVKLLLSAGVDVNAQSGHFGSALYAASAGGHEQIVKLLLDVGADLNAQNGQLGSALQAASAKGHAHIVKLLLDVSANVNSYSGQLGSALYAASDKGHEHIVKLLLNAGADVNAQSEHLGSALQAASYSGHEHIMKLLLNVGADVDAHGGHFGSALQAASTNGHEQAVKLLLSVDADINAQSGYFGSALQAASAKGHAHIVKLLLSMSANVNAESGHFGSALQAASYYGHEHITKILLNEGADVNARGGRFGSVLQAALYHGHEHIVKLLVSVGAEVNPEGEPFGTALYAASDNGHVHIVKLLLNLGIDANAHGGYHGGALQTASYKGHEHIVKLLIKGGADVNAQIQRFGSALYAASSSGYEPIVRLLLDAGAEVNAYGGHYGSALYVASAKGHEHVVQLLLNEGANITAWGGGYGSALCVATLKGQERIVKLLLEKGADQTHADDSGQVPLEIALDRGYEAILELLLAQYDTDPQNDLDAN